MTELPNQGPPSPDRQRAGQELVAYEIYSQTDMPIEPAPIRRGWMDQTQSQFAYRCLPLTLANQAGWVIRNPVGFSATWFGGPRPEDTSLVFDGEADLRISSLFGHGVVTFNLPYLFRTPEGVNLWVRGPANEPMDGAQALEGIVETDWTAASFTMNWKLTRPGLMVRFERWAMICLVLPLPRDLFASLAPRRAPLAEDPELESRYRRWSNGRNAYHSTVAAGDEEAIERGWQKDYFQGRDPGEERFDNHQTKLNVPPFES